MRVVLESNSLLVCSSQYEHVQLVLYALYALLDLT